jgi:hypothetical protein
MAKKIEVEVTGRSKYGIAHMMAVNILTVIKKKKFSELTRKEYLTAVTRLMPFTRLYSKGQVALGRFHYGRPIYLTICQPKALYRRDVVAALNSNRLKAGYGLRVVK